MGMEHLDTIIAFVVIVAGVSVLVTILTQAASALLALRGSNLRWGLTTLLKELTELIPSDAYLTTLNLRGGRLTLDGQARSASDIITALEKSKRFKGVSFSSPTTRQGDKERFALTAEVVK